MDSSSLAAVESVPSALVGSAVRDPLPFISRAGEMLAGSLDYEQTLDRLLDIVVPSLADMCSIHLLDDDGRFKRIANRHRDPVQAALSDRLGNAYLDHGERDGPIHRLLANGTSLLSSPVTDDDLDLIVGAEQRRLIVQRLGVSSVMLVPLIAHGRPFGTIVLSTAHPRPPFGQSHLLLAAEVGRRAALAVDSARLYRDAQQSRLEADRSRQRMAFLADASAALAASLDVHITLQTVVRLAVPTLAECCSVATIDDDGAIQRTAVAHVDPRLQRLIEEQGPRIPIEARPEHPMLVALATGAPVLVTDMQDEHRQVYGEAEYLTLLRELAFCTLLVIPLEARGRRLGALSLATSDPAQGFSADDVAFGVELAGRAALALDNARLYRDACIATEHLQQQLGLSDAIVRNIAEGIVVVDRVGRITYLNPVAEQLLGRTHAEVVGQHGHDVMHVRDAGGAPLPAQECPGQAVFQAAETLRLDDQVFVRADGTTFPVSLTASPLVRGGHTVGAVTVFRDVSEEQRHREAMQKSEARLQRALKSAGMVMWERDFTTERTVRSDLAGALFGRPNEELVDDPESFLRLVHPKDRERIENVINEAARHRSGYVMEFRTLWPDGTVRWLMSRARVFRDDNGISRGISGTTHDITARMLAEQQVTRLLAERGAEAEELRGLHRRLQRSLEALLGLHEVGKLLMSVSDLDAVGRRLLEIAVRAARLRAAALRRRTDGRRSRLWQRVGHDAEIQAVWRSTAVARARRETMASGQAAIVQVPGAESVRPDESAAPDAITGWCIPLMVKGEVIGVLEAIGEPRPSDEATLEILGSIASQAATALENARLYREVADSERDLRRLVHRLMAAQEDERRRLAYEIHDGVAQMATGVQQILEAYAHDFPGDSPAGRHRMEVVIGLARRTVSEIRSVLAGMRPTVLDDFGLARGLRTYADSLRSEAFQVALAESLGSERLSSDIETALFRLAQEALTNVRKHAGVSGAELRLMRSGNDVVLEVQDCGQGFVLTAVERGARPGEQFGLLSMHERIAQVGGALEIASTPGAGTLVRAVVPAPRRQTGAAQSGTEA